jgi:hypothetical protein
MTLTINGRLEGLTDGAVSFPRVEAYSAVGRRGKPLAVTTADAAGAFHIDFDDARLAEVGSLIAEGVVFRVLRDAQPLAAPERSPVWRPERAAEEIAVPVFPGEPEEILRIDGRVVNAADRRPLPGLVVRALVSRRQGEELGTSLADEEGRFSLAWPAAMGRSVNLEVRTSTGDVVHEAQLRSRRSGREAQLRVAMPVAGEDSLADVLAGSGLRVSRRLVAALAKQGVTTLADLTAADLGQVAADADPRALRSLRALAALNSLSTSGVENVQLVRLGYDSLAAIATMPRGDFVEAAGEALGELRAATVHVEARAQEAFLSTVVAGERAEAAFRSGASTPIAGPSAGGLKCSCEDCESAVSPGAYLAELLRYALDHVADDGNVITLNWLGSNFHQPFRDLPASCESAGYRVRQIRICIEVLRSYLKSVWSSIPQERRDALAEVERDYLVAAYEQLLLGIGTTHEEIRLARTGSASERRELAQRLGIEPGATRPDRLDLLLLESTSLTEANLEQRFGLKSTSSTNPLAPPPAGELLDWRSDWLRMSWQASDWPSDPWVDEDAPPTLPVVDPNLLTLRDFRLPLQQNRAYAVWQARDAWMTSRLGELEDERVQNGLNAALEEVFGAPLPDFDQLLDRLDQGSEAARQELADLELTEDSFRRLMEIRAKDTDPTAVPTDAEWRELDFILGQAEKRKQFPTWIQDEQAQGIRLTQEFFFLPLDAWIPPQWLGSAAARIAWAEGLRRRSEPPALDPDLVFPGDLRDPAPGDSAYDLWQNRRTWIDQRVSSFMQRARTRPTLDTIMRPTLGVTQGQLDRLVEDHKRRMDTSKALQRLTIDPAAFAYLVRIRDLLDAGGQITDDEWLGVSSVLAQVLKRREVGEWKRVERLEGLLVGPDRFRLQEEPLLGLQLPEWRASARARDDWVDLLAARVEQDESVAEAVETAVDEAEEAAMPLLRDALVLASDAPPGEFAERAKWLADRLMIDTQAAACNRTTRVSQAIETIQGLLFQLRTDQLRDTLPDLVLNADRFDEEWEWLGSYANLRAALFVLFYPENLLIPSLRRQQTPAFRRLVAELRANRRLSPSQAVQSARDHARYYRDVCSLFIEATARGATRVARTGLGSVDFRDCFYVFGRGSSGDVYVSCHNFSDQSGYAHGFWSKIDAFDGVDVQRIIGAFADKYGDDRFLWLFARVRSEGEDKLVLTRMSLDEGGGWKEPEELDLPDEASTWTAVAVQTDSARPHLAILTREEGVRRFYLRPIAGTDWEEDDWTPLTLRRSGAAVNDMPDDIHAAVEIYGEWGICLFARYGQTVEALFLNPLSGTSPLVRNWSLGNVPRFEGAFVLGESPGPDDDLTNPGDARIYALWYDGFVTRYRAFRWPRTHDVTSFVQSTNSILDGPEAILAVPDGSAQIPKPLAFTRQTGQPGIYVAQINRLGVDSVLNETNRRPIAPQFPVPPDILDIFEQIQDPLRRPMLFGSTLPTIEGAFGRAANQVASNRTYLEEAYYFVPVQIALQFQQRGEFTDALDWFRTVYEYGAPLFDQYGTPVDERKIYYGLREEEQFAFGFSRTADWLLDPLNPHAIASTRRNTYTRFTELSVGRCLLDYADSEYAQDTPETVPRARALYHTALELLRLPELDQTLGSCDLLIGRLDIQVGGPEWVEAVRNLGRQIVELGSIELVEAIVDQVNATLAGGGSWDVRFQRAREIVADARSAAPETPAIAGAIDDNQALETEWRMAVLRQPVVVDAMRAVGVTVAAEFETAAAATLGPLVGRDGYRISGLRSNGDGDDARASTSYPVTGSGAQALDAYGGFGTISGYFVPPPVYSYCVPPNPLLRTLRLWAELNLFKLRNCMNIAGLERELEPYAAPTDTETGLPAIGAGGQLTLPGTLTFRPTPYPFPILRDRARELAGMASQFEASMFAAIQQGDQERYDRLKANQDVSLTRAGVRLQELRVRQAEGGVKLAELQKQRAVIQATHYQELLEAGPTPSELSALEMLKVTAGLHAMASGLSFFAMSFNSTAAGLSAAAGPLGAVSAAAQSGAAASAAASAVSSLAAGTATVSSVLNTLASWERRAQEWEFARTLALQDTAIGDQQIRSAQDYVRVANQDRQIARMQSDHAEEVVDFLATKFTNAELYDFMADVLEGVYVFFLQQGTAMSQLAYRQLAFARGELPPTVPRADYREAPSEDALGRAEDGAGPDRRGLTGSARLLRDITELDQYAFETDRRKLQLAITFSLARLAPAEFARFRQTGELRFNITREMLARQFPDQYLRLIKRIRTTVIALIPPSTGIRARLARIGPSYTVVGGPPFQRVAIQPTGAEVALSSPFEDSGVFELDAQPEMRGVFEDEGLEGGWLFEMLRPANPFSFETLADVLITFEYTALRSDEYRRQVIQSLDPDIRGDRAFSFRTAFADQWYDLNNPDETATPMTVTFRTEGDDFPPNLNDLEIRNVVLLLARSGGGQFEDPVQIDALRFEGTGGAAKTSLDGVASSRTTATAWVPMAGKEPVGEWTLAFPDDEETRDLFAGTLEDIVLVVSFSGEAPPWS